MKRERQAAIRRILEEKTVRTQGELAEALISDGFRVTQATVSRDMKDMRLTKVAVPEGGYRYAAPAAGSREAGQRMVRLLADCVTGVETGGQMIVVKTLSGAANTAAEALDVLGMPEIMGSIAGDNTIFLAARDPEGAAQAGERIRRMARKGAKPID
ncbi:MAG: arginine repressor [Clostridia bacterium]|nr:arginine repressor [Clostridia bacterium]